MNKSQVLIKRLCAYLHYLRQLPTVKTFSLDGKKLVLKTADGKELVFDEIGNVKK